tara:strand:- start:27766 stop:28011 length:246 start_codon:yes stop_codon:yes gene_type:complete
MQPILEKLKSKIIELILKNKELLSANHYLRKELRTSQIQREILEGKIKKTSDELSDLLSTHFTNNEMHVESIHRPEDHENS